MPIIFSKKISWLVSLCVLAFFLATCAAWMIYSARSEGSSENQNAGSKQELPGDPANSSTENGKDPDNTAEEIQPIGAQTGSSGPGADAAADADKELKEQIGQMLIAGFRGIKIDKNSAIAKQVKDLNLGGVILFDYDNPSKSFPRNITDPDQTEKLIKDLQSFSSTPLFVSVDAEGGLVNRLKEKYGFASFPSPEDMGKLNDLAKTQATGKELGSELKGLGFNLDFAPPADVNVNPDNPIIGKLGRSFSQDPQIVASQAIAFIKGLHENNIITAIKHFPGHGSSQSDSHLGLVDVTKTYQQKELIPFETIIGQNQADMVMTAHIINTNIDPQYPATLSPLFLQNILRDRLGFKGVIVSDDMQMGAIAKNYGFEDALIRSINAGCDLLILSNNNDTYDGNIAAKARDAIFQAVKDGKISEERISGSYDRITEIKKKFGIIN
ncbi:MAG: glycoside hydrolase family 3 N-terminal domain-containing protein [Candidatus Paceibacterota bacterium]|jgi:beta-N-acetylhexosaminidase